MKKVLLVTSSLIALGAAAPAVCCGSRCASLHQGASDGRCGVRLDRFLHRCERRLGFEPQLLGFWLRLLVGSEGSHDATGGTVGGQVGYRWQAGTFVFGLEAQGNWADFSGSNVSQVFPGFRNHTNVDAFGLFTGQVGYAVNNVLLYVKGGAAVTSNSYRVNNVSAARSPASPATTPAGAARSAPASNTPSLRTGRLASSTITCSCRTVPTTSPRRPAQPSAPTASVRTSISSPPA